MFRQGICYCLTLIFIIFLFTGCEDHTTIQPVTGEGDNTDPGEEVELIRGGSRAEELLCMHKTNEGGFLFGGYTSSTPGNDKDVFLVEISSTGQYSWSNSFGGLQNDEVFDILLSGSYYLMVGYSFLENNFFADIQFSLTDLRGINQETYLFGESLDDFGVKVIEGYRSEIVLAATTDSSTATLIGINPTGSIFWEKEYGDGIIYDAIESPETGFVLAGVRRESGRGYDALVIKTDSYGDEIWTQTYGTGLDEKINAINTTDDGGFILAGATDIFDQSDAYLLKISGDGNLEWDLSFGASYRDAAHSVIQTDDGGYVIAGKTEIEYDSDYYKGYVVKIDAGGNLEWERKIGDEYSGYFYVIDHANSSGYWAAGTKETAANSWDCWIRYIMADPPEEAD